MKRYILLILISFMMLPTGCKKTQQLKIHLSLDKSKYQLLDNIQATVNVGNTGNPVKINVRFKPLCFKPFETDWEISFVIFNTDGKEYNPNCPMQDWSEPWYRSLDAGGVYQYTDKRISDFYGIREPGKYTIQVVYQNYSGSSDVWKGEIKSNIVTFTISP
jgi:hypothetical protein